MAAAPERSPSLAARRARLGLPAAARPRLGWLLKPFEARESTIAIVLVALGLALTPLYPQFGTLENIDNILLNVSEIAVVGVGMTMVIVTGGIDVSVGSALAVCAVLVGQRVQAGDGIPIAILVGVGAGLAIGLVNGLLITFGRVHPIVITFGMLYILRVIAFEATGGRWISNLPNTLGTFGNGRLVYLPVAWWIAMALALLGTYYLRRRPTGRHLYALGGNPEMARLAGVAVSRRTIFVYAITGLLVGVASIIYVGGTGVVQENAGVGFELDVIAATVIGGTNIMGGRGSVIGTLLGALLVGAIRNALVVVNVNALYEGFVVGVLILVTVALDVVAQRRRSVRAEA